METGAGGTMTSRRAQIARMRRVALAALDRYELPPGRLTFVAHGENTTFRHDSAAGRFLVRVHRPQRHGRGVDSAAAISSELTWLRAIRTETDLHVPEPLTAADGATTVEAAAAAGETRVCSVLRWMDGRLLERSARPVHLRRLGAAMALLHHQADGWTPPAGFVRIRWDHEAFFGDAMVYGETSAADCWALLPKEARTRFEAVAARTADLDRLDDVGLVHADLHLGNAVFHRGEVGLIDFDDCGTGPRLYDLAVALWELRDEDGYQVFRDALLDGYRQHRAIDVSRLDDLIAVRQVSFDLWATGMAQVNPSFADRLDRVHRWSLEILDLLETPST